ncbi:MAG TPA: hypothetical protein PKD10_19775, partial [Paracoccaceae bacterium]|nr:hypothetical protein [Paracoccaceae bacterium]
ARLAPARVAARLQAEGLRLAQMRARAVPPEPMLAAPVAPARGPMILVREIAMVRGSTERAKVTGHHWRGACMLEVMCRQALDRHAGEGPFLPPFTAGQIATAERYRALVERHGAAGLRCASAETRAAGSGGGDGRGFIDAYLDEGAEIARMLRRIGEGEALSVRRIRPSRREGRRGIGLRALVDDVVLRGRSISAVLRAAGWSVKGDHREALRLALGGALDRMQSATRWPQDDGA